MECLTQSKGHGLVYDAMFVQYAPVVPATMTYDCLDLLLAPSCELLCAPSVAVRCLGNH